MNRLLFLLLALLVAARAAPQQAPDPSRLPPHLEPNRIANRLAQTPPMGWNSWNKSGCNINEQIVRRTADAIVCASGFGLWQHRDLPRARGRIGATVDRHAVVMLRLQP